MALKGYWLAHVTVKNQADYDEYRMGNAVAFAKFGGRFIVRGRGECKFGSFRAIRPRSIASTRLNTRRLPSSSNAAATSIW